MSKRFECHRKLTGRTRFRSYLGFIHFEDREWSVLTNLPSHDITDEWHTEWEAVKLHIGIKRKG